MPDDRDDSDDRPTTVIHDTPAEEQPEAIPVPEATHEPDPSSGAARDERTTAPGAQTGEHPDPDAEPRGAAPGTVPEYREEIEAERAESHDRGQFRDVQDRESEVSATGTREVPPGERLSPVDGEGGGP